MSIELFLKVFRKFKYKFFFPFLNILVRIRNRILRIGRVQNDAALAQSYIDNQEDAYQSDDDPWSNFSGPLYRILHLHYEVTAACLEKNDNIILDMGCGLGVFTHLLHEKGKTVVGVDTSVTAISKAQAKFPGLKFEVGDVRFWGKQLAEKFDAVFLMDCYHRMGKKDKLLALDNVHRLLKKNGKIIIAYGLDEYLSGRQTDVYPDLFEEIFIKFKPLQVIRRQAIDFDTKADNSNRLYVGVKK